MALGLANALSFGRYGGGTGGSGAFLPSNLPGLAAWYRFNTGITEAGAGVSQWDDQSGLGHHLLQGTDTNRPAKQVDGSILFDGVDNFLKATGFTLNQPETVYILFRNVTWTVNDYIFDGNTVNTGILAQVSTTPGINAYAGAFIGQNNNLVVNTYGAVAVVYNSTSSVLQVNNTTPTTGNTGTANMGGFTLGGRGDNNPVGSSNIQVKEVIIYSVAHNEANRSNVIAYLNTL